MRRWVRSGSGCGRLAERAILEITWLGHACFRLRSKEGVVVTDPYGPSLGLALGKPTADIVTVSHHSPHHAHVAGVGGSPRVIEGPGEYEVHNIAITGVQTQRLSETGQPVGMNTVYLYEMDDLVVCHLGDLGRKLSESEAEEMPDVDILLVPVGGVGTLNAAQASEVISQLEPKLVVPMHYKADGANLELDGVDRFLRELGVTDAEPQPKLTIAKSNLPETMQVVVLEPRRGT